MISFLGRGVILLGLASASIGAVVGMVAGWRQSQESLRWTRILAYTFGACMLVATALMEYALITHDFSVGYVAQVGSTTTPLIITVVSLWSALEGSILFWGLVLGLYTVCFAWSTRGRHDTHSAYGIGALLAVAVFFCFLIASVADPFQLQNPVPVEGPGPNPLLQNHPLMIIHPPALYLGFVGMSVPFAMAVGALLAGSLDAAWLRLLRRWTLLVWSFLTLGILLGGWWSYEVLGWGGYWAWDPVENASFMPWLVATAFLHSAMVSERKGLFNGWSLVLIISAFLLTLLGTFMTRSGVFNSVHSFTQSPIGPLFLIFIGVVLVLMLVLLSARLGHLANADKRMDSPLSREGSFLLNNLLLVGFAFTVLLGTLYPLIVEATTSERISVGAPYFDTMTAPICMGLIFLMGVGPVLPWGRAEPALMKQLFVRPLALGFVMAAVLFLLGLRNGWVLTTWGLAVFAASASLREIWLPARARMRGQGENALNAVWTASRKGRRRFGGHIVHLGVVVIAVSLASAGAYRQHQDLTLEKGESAEVYGHTLTFIQSELQDQPHRVSQVALFEVRRGGGRTQELAPRINRYKARGDEVPTPAVLSAPDADFYLSLLRVDEEQASVRVIHQPLVLWIWVGGLMMVIGGLIASFPERLLARKRASA